MFVFCFCFFSPVDEDHTSDGPFERLFGLYRRVHRLEGPVDGMGVPLGKHVSENMGSEKKVIAFFVTRIGSQGYHPEVVCFADVYRQRIPKTCSELIVWYTIEN